MHLVKVSVKCKVLYKKFSTNRLLNLFAVLLFFFCFFIFCMLHPLKSLVFFVFDLKIFSLFAMASSPEAKLQTGQSFLFDCLFVCSIGN